MPSTASDGSWINMLLSKTGKMRPWSILDHTKTTTTTTIGTYSSYTPVNCVQRVEQSWTSGKTPDSQHADPGFESRRRFEYKYIYIYNFYIVLPQDDTNSYIVKRRHSERRHSECLLYTGLTNHFVGFQPWPHAPYTPYTLVRRHIHGSNLISFPDIDPTSGCDIHT